MTTQHPSGSDIATTARTRVAEFRRVADLLLRTRRNSSLRQLGEISRAYWRLCGTAWGSILQTQTR